jgi:hypothetical protein
VVSAAQRAGSFVERRWCRNTVLLELVRSLAVGAELVVDGGLTKTLA